MVLQNELIDQSLYTKKNMTSRRDFLKITGAAIGTAALGGSLVNTARGATSPATATRIRSATDGQAATSSSFSLGFQSWTLREDLAKDPKGTMKKMAAMGYQEIEFCSPLGYTGTGFEVFNSMSGTELKKLIEGTGLFCRSSHYNMGELRESLDNRIEWSKQMGISQVIASSFWLPEGATLDDYRKACTELNSIGKKLKSAGLQAGFHNHHMEFARIGDTLIYDVLMQTLDPEYVKMQFQVAVISIGYKASDYFRKYPGRFISAHLADWSAEKNDQVPAGQGVVDWKEFFEAAKIGGVQNYFVEMEPVTFPESATYLNKLQAV
jgi:sugar phosphate isomerase/epimerase